MSLSQQVEPTSGPGTGPSSTVSGSASTSDGRTDAGYAYGTSKIVRTAVAAGLIVLALSALVLFLKISSWIRYRQRRRRQETLTLALQSEQRAKVFEIAAWADEPGQAPVRSGTGAAAGFGGSAGTGASSLARRGLRWVGIGRSRGGWMASAEDKRRDKEQKQQMRATKRGGANAYAVVEWEGIPS